jgi:ornithine cyclodeaminase/alanine dehydrogenase-like protein (mu-crystallin family)
VCQKSGGRSPHAREVDSITVGRARIVVEAYDAALAEAGDLLIPMGEGSIDRDQIKMDLHEMVTRKKPGRTTADDITLFKSVGNALEDLVGAELVEQSLSPK